MNLNKRAKSIAVLLMASSILSCSNSNYNLITTQNSNSDLQYDSLARSWDEAFPLGNGFVGALVWQKDNALRFSLDRVDLWDLREVDNFNDARFSYEWVKQQVRKGDYAIVQELFDLPYERDAYPAKIPGGAIELPLDGFGDVVNADLHIDNGVCAIEWNSGVKMKTFVDANAPIGWFVFDNFKGEFNPSLIAPLYQKATEKEQLDSHSGADLQRLGYEQGEVIKDGNLIYYHQKGSLDFYYDIAIKWSQKGESVVGAWSVTSSIDKSEDAKSLVCNSLESGIESAFNKHNEFWNDYNSLSSISIPNKTIEKQYNNEMYKLASVSRHDSYPISLQAVWTADNGKLPPWKGDYHHDLNTQLSSWPTYIGNRLDVGYGYLHTLWNQREKNKQFTKEYYGSDGLNVPGVATLTGDPMGGWIQYSLSPTTSAWLAQHFYLHWRYSGDREFLKNRAYPYISDVATHLEQMTIINSNGERTLEFSTSPEINDNSIDAYFKTITNYDLALIKFAFRAAAELAGELKLDEKAKHWHKLESELPDFDLDSDGSLTFAKGNSYDSSHRHFSHAMAIHPISLIDWSQGEKSQQIIKATIGKLDHYGSDWWTGYTYSWLANMKARMFDGEGAERALEIFATSFCLQNTFHVNGDQSGSGKSKFTYRPFTLEGNFAFAAGVQEMLLQSHTGIIKIFPAIPHSWTDLSFDKLRAVGGFLISAKKENDKVTSVKIYSERGGKVKIEDPFTHNNKIIELSMKEGETIELK